MTRTEGARPVGVAPRDLPPGEAVELSGLPFAMGEAARTGDELMVGTDGRIVRMVYPARTDYRQERTR